MNRCLFVFLFFLCFQPGKAGDSTRFDNNYIVSYRDYLAFYFYTNVPTNRFSYLFGENLYDYRPNEVLHTGLGFDYQWLGLAGSVSMRFLNRDDELYGKTNSFDLQSGLNWSAVNLGINLQYYQGFYLNNMQDFYTGWKQGMPHEQREDMAAVTLGVTGLYFVNHHKFTLSAPFSHTAKQIKGAGSFILGGFLSVYAMNADSGMLPASTPNAAADSINYRFITSTDIGLLAGYARTFRLSSNWFTTLLLVPGFSAHGSESVLMNGEFRKEEKKAGLRIITRFALGYDNGKWYGGINAFSTSQSFTDQRKGNYSYIFGYTSLYFGLRIDVRLKE
ncbi:MAG: DUF4421 family protein [Bacteroidales bacterium]